MSQKLKHDLEEFVKSFIKAVKNPYGNVQVRILNSSGFSSSPYEHNIEVAGEYSITFLSKSLETRKFLVSIKLVTY